MRQYVWNPLVIFLRLSVCTSLVRFGFFCKKPKPGVASMNAKCTGLVVAAAGLIRFGWLDE